MGFKKGNTYGKRFKKGNKITEEQRKRLIEFNTGRKLSEKTKRKISHALKGRIPKNLNFLHNDLSIRDKLSKARTGENNPRWIKDRTQLVKKQIRNDYAYQDWRKQVWTRDNWKCRIADENCGGRMEAHHILGWKSHPELRYQINNGITLCHSHHPHKREDEEKLSSYFQKMVAEMKII